MAEAVAHRTGWPFPGRGGRGFDELLAPLLRAFWFAMLAVAMAMPAVSAWQLAHLPENPHADGFATAGLQIQTTKTGFRLHYPLSEDARRAGIAPGDRLVSIEGRAIPDSPGAIALAERLLRGEQGSRVRLVTQTSAGEFNALILTRRADYAGLGPRRAGISPAIQAWTLYALNLIPALFMLIVATLLYWRRGLERVTFLLSLCYLTGAASLRFAEAAPPSFAVETMRWSLDLLTALFGVAAMLQFPDGKFILRWTRWVALAMVPWTALLLAQLVPTPLIQLVQVAQLLLIVNVVLLRLRRYPPGPERQQIRWAIFGVALGAPPILLSLLLFLRMSLPLSDVEMVWTWFAARALSSIFYILVAGGMLVSLLRYRLYDADSMISRSAGYALLTLAIAAVFAGTSETIKWIVESGLGQDAGVMPAAVAAGVATLLVTPAHDRIIGWAGRRFQGALLRMRRDLPLAAGDLRETATLDMLLADVLRRIETGVRASRAAVLLGQNDALQIAAVRGVEPAAVAEWLAAHRPDESVEHLDCDRADTGFPIRIPLRDAHAAAIGWIVLGPRPDGSFYGKDEREALAEIADPVGRAIAVVRQRQQREAEADARVARQDRRIATLERKLAKLAGVLAPSKAAPRG